MSQNTPIQSFENKSKLNRTGEALGNVWIANKTPSKSATNQGPFLFSGENTQIPDTVSNIFASCTDRLFISTQSFSDSTIIQAVEDALRRSVRIYMLLDTAGFESMLSNDSCRSIIGNVLLRERQLRGLDLILSDWHLPTAQGLLISSPLDGTLNVESSGWAMELDKNQIDELSMHVQHEFWSSRAPGREVLSADEEQEPPDIAEAPAALASIYNRNHVLRAHLSRDGDNSKAEVALRKEKKWEGQIVGDSGQSSITLQGESIEVGTDAAEILHSSPKNVEPSSGLFAHAGLSVQLAIGTESYLAGWDRTASGDWHSILRLNAEQAKAAKALLQSHSKEPEWVGHSKIKLGDAGDRIVRNGSEMSISDKQTESLGIVHLDKMPDSAEALETHQPTMQAPESSLARQCTFEWITAPPVVPASAKEDALHEEWMSARKDMTHRLNALNEVNQPSKFPGFKRKQGALKKSIDSALAQSGSVADPKGLSALVSSIEALTEAVGGNIDGIKAAENESLLSTLEEEQREAHKNAVQEAKNTVKRLTPKIKKEEKQLSDLEAAAKKAEDVEKNRIESDIEPLRPKIGEMESQLTQAKETSGSKFEFKPPADISPSKKGDKKAHKFLGDTRAVTLDVTVPKEALPEGGTLFRDGDDRYLAISHWEEVPQGRKDARRLKASLCAVREVIE